MDGLASAADIYCYSAPTTASTGWYTELSTYWPTQESTSSSTTSSTTTTTTEPSPVSTTTTSSSPPLTTSSPDPDCDALCEDVEDAFLTEGCCAPKYCLCSSGMGYLMTCQPEGETFFCPEEQACVYGCLERPECCDAETTSLASPETTQQTSTSTLTSSGPDCVSLCAGQDSGTAGDCCAQEYCDCSDNSLVTCSGDEQYCPAIYDGCQNMYGACLSVCC